MKKSFVIALLTLLATKVGAFACEVCQAQQPAITRGLTHGSGPQGNFDYVIVAASAVIVVFTLIFSIKYLVRPGERGQDHIKRTILNFE